MNTRDINGFLIFASLLALLLLLIFGILQWLGIPSGSFLDWMIGVASFWWLLIIVTIPWNIHFAAKGVLMAAAESRRQGIALETTQQGYVQRVAQRSLWGALGLHLLSALVLYGMAATGISSLGYIGAIATLLLTGLRPAIALCQHLIDQMQTIHQSVRYPRHDVMELRGRLGDIETQLKSLTYQLNLDPEQADYPDSWATQQQRAIASLRQDLTQLAVGVEDLRVHNQADHERLGREARNAIAQLSTDSQFLEHVREILRFFKTA